ncbi:unnamed protein product [Amoebophrya sp. A120]|nr:unnamed protein product [Amoebophrya sp. A120]|eukprot:GSA120T00022692001.1
MKRTRPQEGSVSPGSVTPLVPAIHPAQTTGGNINHTNYTNQVSTSSKNSKAPAGPAGPGKSEVIASLAGHSSYQVVDPSGNMQMSKRYYTEYADVVKAGQRCSTNFKNAWHAYCESQGHVMYDPAKHEVTFIQGFLDNLGKGYLTMAGQQHQITQNGVTAYPNAAQSNTSTPANYGGSRYGSDGAYTSDGTPAGMDYNSSGGGYTPAGGKKGGGKGGNNYGYGAAPGNYQNGGGAGNYGYGASNSQQPTQMYNHQQGQASQTAANASALGRVIELVKQGQRNSAEWKTMWIDWAQENGNGVHDPTRHQACFIIAFVLKYGLAEVVSAPWASPYLVSLGELAKPYMVSSIKKGQSISEVWKEQWGLFADSKANGTRDPNRHDAGSLMEFFDTIALQQFSTESWMLPYVNGSEPVYSSS